MAVKTKNLFPKCIFHCIPEGVKNSSFTSSSLPRIEANTISYLLNYLGIMDQVGFLGCPQKLVTIYDIVSVRKCILNSKPSI